MPVNLFSVAFAWLATHLVVISLLGFLVAGLFVSGLLDTPGGASVQQKKTHTAPSQPRLETPPVSAPVMSRPGAVQPDGEELVPRDVTGGDAMDKQGQRQPPRMIGGSLPIYREEGAVSSSPDPTPTEDKAFRPPSADAGTGPVSMTRDDYVQHARRAFWNGEFEAAEAAYMALLAQYPADADAFGELGNLYHSMGKPARALDAYYEAAVRLKAAGESEKFKEVMELLAREGDHRIDELGR